MKDKRYVYIAKIIGTHGVYKIGSAVDTEQRMLRKEKQKNFKMEVVSRVAVRYDLADVIESRLHTMFDKSRLGADWFALDPTIIARFDTMVLALERMYENE